jgi:hypothetical protein
VPVVLELSKIVSTGNDDDTTVCDLKKEMGKQGICE